MRGGGDDDGDGDGDVGHVLTRLGWLIVDWEQHTPRFDAGVHCRHQCIQKKHPGFGAWEEGNEMLWSEFDTYLRANEVMIYYILTNLRSICNYYSGVSTTYCMRESPSPRCVSLAVTTNQSSVWALATNHI